MTLRDDGPRVVYGINPIRELLESHPKDVERLYLAETGLSDLAFHELTSLAKKAKVRFERVSRDRLQSLADGGVHQGVAAQVKAFQYADLDQMVRRALDSETPALVVVLDGVQDPQNLGAIIRSAVAFGAHGVVIPKDRAAGISGVVVKAAAGATEHCPIARVTNLARAIDDLKEAGLWTVAAAPREKRTLDEARLEGPLALVIGAEGQGVRQNVLSHCDDQVQIPMPSGFESLNASAAAAVVLYEASRQRRLPRRG